MTVDVDLTTGISGDVYARRSPARIDGKRWM